MLEGMEDQGLALRVVMLSLMHLVLLLHLERLHCGWNGAGEQGEEPGQLVVGHAGHVLEPV